MFILTKKGYNQTAVRELAYASSLSIGNFYHYFGSKAELLFYIIYNAATEQLKYVELAAQELEQVEPETALVQLIEKHYKWHDDKDGLTLFIYQETKNLPPNARQEVFETENRIIDLFEKFLRRYIKSGNFNVDDPKLMAHNIVVLGHVWAFRRWFLRKDWTFESYLSKQTKMLLNTIRN